MPVFLVSVVRPPFNFYIEMCLGISDPQNLVQYQHNKLLRHASGHGYLLTMADDDDEWEDGEMEDWNEDECAPTRCLFGDAVFPSAVECLAHAASAYGLDVRTHQSAHTSLARESFKLTPRTHVVERRHV